ncbi:MAG TPA: potassium-transporting ATPase subunit KdpC [Candidatus Binataceae bacterium]|nr:potassium-transporting ATPase subunit KdpC [Candidatus Binataceae bacterium]
MRELWISVRMTIVLTLLLGIIYPIAMTIAGHVLFSHQAEGSLIIKNGSAIGSELIGQNFSSNAYFHGRPSAAGNNGYDATSSGGSNLGPTNKAFIDSVRKRLKDIAESEGVPASKVPIDLITASGSGLDPEISPAAAEVQVARVAKARGMSDNTVSQLVEENTHGRWIGLFGESGVNVLKLNLALDDLKAGAK